METKPKFKSLIEGLICPVHKKRPGIVIQEDNTVKFSYCCAGFKVQCFCLIKKLLAAKEKRPVT
ncbi:MAG: hypothetical protein JWR02_1054 [Mucilaginibacter sp.]|nr:hypothetical protein [Mucilaginibacter sp.]